MQVQGEKASDFVPCIVLYIVKGKSSIMSFVMTHWLKYTDTPLEEWKQ